MKRDAKRKRARSVSATARNIKGSAQPQGLIDEAIKARENALAPYSGFKVGAAIRTRGGRIYTGCNIENVSYGLSVCAERVALWKALSDGEHEFSEMAIVTDADVLTSPCGACRQFLWEYCGDIVIHLHSLKGLDRQHQLAELLPFPFDGRSLKK
jgi:cytidine deaminase